MILSGQSGQKQCAFGARALRTAYQHYNKIIAQARHQFASGDGLHGVAGAKVTGHHRLDLGHVSLADNGERSQQPNDLGLPRRGVHDALAIATGPIGETDYYERPWSPTPRLMQFFTEFARDW
jgi:hypothetical protein